VNFPKLDFATNPFSISTVLPIRTFLEKVFLLHEEFSQAPEKIRVNRLSRHLYDLVRLMNTEFGIAALKDTILYNGIVAHREKFNQLSGIDYNNHSPNKIKIMPPYSVIKDYENDYSEMTKFMIYGEALTFNELLNKISELQIRINKSSPH
jgi:hypothetical protein